MRCLRPGTDSSLLEIISSIPYTVRRLSNTRLPPPQRSKRADGAPLAAARGHQGRQWQLLQPGGGDRPGASSPGDLGLLRPGEQQRPVPARAGADSMQPGQARGRRAIRCGPGGGGGGGGGIAMSATTRERFAQRRLSRPLPRSDGPVSKLPKPVPRDTLRMGLPSKGRMAEDTIQLLKARWRALRCVLHCIARVGGVSGRPCKPAGAPRARHGSMSAAAAGHMQTRSVCQAAAHPFPPPLVSCKPPRTLPCLCTSPTRGNTWHPSPRQGRGLRSEGKSGMGPPAGDHLTHIPCTDNARPAHTHTHPPTNAYPPHPPTRSRA